MLKELYYMVKDDGMRWQILPQKGFDKVIEELYQKYCL
jgi:hypothetical protein